MWNVKSEVNNYLITYTHVIVIVSSKLASSHLQSFDHPHHCHLSCPRHDVISFTIIMSNALSWLLLLRCHHIISFTFTLSHTLYFLSHSWRHLIHNKLLSYHTRHCHLLFPWRHLIHNYLHQPSLHQLNFHLKHLMSFRHTPHLLHENSFLHNQGDLSLQMDGLSLRWGCYKCYAYGRSLTQLW